jgi:hypothetical protein
MWGFISFCFQKEKKETVGLYRRLSAVVITIYYFGFAKKENGKTARWQDGNCRYTVLPFNRFAVLPLTL